MNLVQPDPKKRPLYERETIVTDKFLSSEKMRKVEEQLMSGSFKPSDIEGLQSWIKAGDLTVVDKDGGVAYIGNKVEPWYKKYPRYWRAKFKIWVESWPY